MLKSDAKPPSTDAKEAFEIARRAAYDGVGETFPDAPKKLTPAKKKRTPPKQEAVEDEQGMLYY